MLMIAWTCLGHPEATSASMTYVNTTCFELEMTCKSLFAATSVRIKEYYEFSTPVTSKEQARKEIYALRVASSIVPWPPGPIALITVFAWVIIVASSINEAKTGSRYFHVLRSIGLYVLGTPAFARKLAGALITAHSLEALYVVYLLLKVGMSKVAICTWVALDLLLGIPVTLQARRLHIAYFKNMKNK